MKPWIPSLHTGRVMGLAKKIKKIKRELDELSICLNISVCLLTETQMCRHCTVC